MFYDGCITIREDKKMNESFQKMTEIFETHTQEKGENDMNAQTATVDVTGNMDKKKSASNQKAAALKLMDGKFGGEFLVRYLYDVSTSAGWLQLIIIYPFGAVKKVLLKKNAACRAKWGHTGVETIGQGRDEFAPTRLYGRYSAPNGLLTEFETPDMPIPFKVLWGKIIDNYEKIPIIPVHVCASFRDVYDALIEVGEEKNGQNDKLFRENYVLLTRQEIAETAEEFGTDFVTVRAEFASRGWWEIDRNTMGFQKSVKIGGVKKNFYALKRNQTEDNEYEEFERVESIEKIDYEEINTLEDETKKINEIHRRERETAYGKKKTGKEPITVFHMI